MFYGWSYCWSDELWNLRGWSPIHFSWWLSQSTCAVHVWLHTAKSTATYHTTEPHRTVVWPSWLEKPIRGTLFYLFYHDYDLLLTLINFVPSIIVKLAKLLCMLFSLNLIWRKKAAVQLADYHIHDPFLNLLPLRHLAQQLQYHQISQTKTTKSMRSVRYSRNHILRTRNNISYGIKSVKTH